MNVRIDNCIKVVKEKNKYKIKKNENKMLIVYNGESTESYSLLHYYLDDLNRIVRFYDKKIILELKN